MTQDQILDAIAQTQDPLTGLAIQPEHRVRDLLINGSQISFKLVMPGLAPEAKGALIQTAEMAIKGAVGKDVDVHVHLVTEARPGDTGAAMPQVRNIIAVGSGKGGVGKSTVSVNVALALKARGLKVGLIDADLYGPSIPTMLGLRGQRPRVQEVYGKPKLVPLEAYGMPCISMGSIIAPEQAVVLRGPRLAGIIRQFFLDVVWPELDILLVDLPPGTGDIQLTLVQTVPVTGAVLVTTPQQVALDDAIKAMNMFLLPNVNVPILGVVENMSWFTPVDLPDRRYELFGKGGGKKLAREAKSVLLGQIPLVQGIGEGGDSGVPPATDPNHVAAGFYADIAVKLLRQLALRHEAMPPTQAVQVQ